MDKTVLKKRIVEIFKEDVGIFVFFVLKDATVKKANINELASKPILNNLKENVNKLIRLLVGKQYSIINLSVADERVNTLYLYDLGEQPKSFNAMKEVLVNGENGEYWKDKMFVKKDNVREIDGIIIMTGINNGPYFISYAKHYAILTYTTKDHWYIFNPDSQIGAIKGPIIKIDGHFDYFLVEIDGKPTYFINNLKVIEKYDDIKNVVVNQSKKVVDKLKGFKLVDNLDPIKKRIDNDIAFARKFMGAVNSSGDVLKQNESDIISFVQGNEELNQVLIVKNGKINLADDKAQMAFIALLNDDMLHSKLTNNDYHVLAKDKIKRKKKKG